MQRILSSSHPLHFVSSFFTFLNSYILFYFLLSVLLLLLPLLHVNLHTMAAALLPEQSQKLLQLHQLCAFLFHFQHRLNAKTKDIHAVDIRRQTSFTCWNNLEICFLPFPPPLSSLRIHRWFFSVWRRSLMLSSRKRQPPIVELTSPGLLFFASNDHLTCAHPLTDTHTTTHQHQDGIGRCFTASRPRRRSVFNEHSKQ